MATESRQSSESVHRAVGRMTQAEGNLERGQLSDAAENVQESLDDLEQAARELAETRRQLEEQLAQEHLERIADALKSLISRQHRRPSPLTSPRSTSNVRRLTPEIQSAILPNTREMLS